MGLSELREARLVAVRYGALDILFYEFEPLDGLACEPVVAGSHLDIVLPMGLIRQYSLISSMCDADRYIVAVKRESAGRGGSKWLHDVARVGQVMKVGRPRNLFAVQAGAAPVLLLAGGIGITPIYAMFKELQASGREVRLHYWCKSPQQALFRRELEGRADVDMYYSQRVDGIARRGLAHALGDLGSDTVVYCCGPDSMIRELDSLTSALEPGRVMVERFQAVMEPDKATSSFTVVLAKSERELLVGAGETILDVLRDAGVDVMYSCEQGICGACEVEVLDGSPLHRDKVRSAEAHDRGNTMMICCSGCTTSKLVIDI